MLVQLEDFDQVLRILSQQSLIAIDTETTGLRAYHGDKPFAIIVATKDDTFYFNFQEYPGITPLPYEMAIRLNGVFLNPQIHKLFHNAKFDMKMLARLGVLVENNVHDLWSWERIYNNDHLNYTLAQVAKRWGREKLDEVKKYVKKHKLSRTEFIPELNKEVEYLFYDQVPFDLMYQYALTDARITFDIGTEILQKMKHIDSEAPPKWAKLQQVIDNESKILEVLFKMEHRGVKIDRPYCEKSRDYYMAEIDRCSKEFKNLTGLEFVKGTTVFEEVFKDEVWTYTEKGNPQFDKKAMKRFKHPAAGVVGEYAEAKKQLEYFQNFLFFADSNDVIHPDFAPAGTTTGRLSCRDPNLQNLTKPDKYGDDEEGTSNFPVRKAFIPRDGFFLAMLDYSQIEYRVMLDMANAKALIKKIMIDGLDVHGATSSLANVTRQHAKTVNFLTLYGGGVAKLASDLFPTLGSLKQLQVFWMRHLGFSLRTEEDRAVYSTVTDEMKTHNLPLLQQAKGIQDAIFKASPEIKDFMDEVSGTAKTRGFIRDWLGRRFQFKNKAFTYKATNHLIQGSCADILKVAMVEVDKYLKPWKTKMVLTIHDELVLEVAFGEEFLVQRVKTIMETVYKYSTLPLVVEAEWSSKNLADKSDWEFLQSDNGEKERNGLQGEGISSLAGHT